MRALRDVASEESITVGELAVHVRALSDDLHFSEALRDAREAGLVKIDYNDFPPRVSRCTGATLILRSFS